MIIDLRGDDMTSPRRTSPMRACDWSKKYKYPRTFRAYAGRIYGMDGASYDSGGYRAVVASTRSAISVDFDYEDNYVYWSDVFQESILRARYNHSPWYNIGQGYHWEGLFESYIIGKLEISKFQIQLIAISNFQQKCSFEHFSKMADVR